MIQCINVQVWKPKAIREKEAAEQAAYEKPAAETRVVLPAGPTVVGESDEAAAPVESVVVAADEPVAEVKANLPKPKIEWLVAADEPTVVHDAAPVAEEAAGLEAKSEIEPVAEEKATPPKPRIEYLEAADEPTVVHDIPATPEVHSAPVVEAAVAEVAPEKKEYKEETALEAKTETEPVAYAAAEPVVETVAEPIVEVKAVPAEDVPAVPVAVEEKKEEYKATALEAKTDAVSYDAQPAAAPVVAISTVEDHSAPVISTVETHSDVVAVAAPVEEVHAVAEVAVIAPVADALVEEPVKVVEAEPEIVPVETAPAVIVLDEPVAHSEPVVPSKKTETIAY